MKNSTDEKSCISSEDSTDDSLLIYPLKFKSSPFKEALWISFVYLFLGVLWILLSDRLLIILVDDPSIRDLLQLYKGWFYVVATSVVFFLIIKRRMQLHKRDAENVIYFYEELEKSREQMQYLAYHDPLTGLHNRIYFLEKASKKIAQAKKKGEKLAVVIIDIDRFKNINDICGHSAGDNLLKDMASILNEVKGSGIALSRLGGNEYGLICVNIGDVEKLKEYVNSINQKINRVWKFEGVSFHLTVSMGIAIFPDHGDNCDIILKEANTALAFTKDAGRNSYVIYNEEMLENVKTQISLTSLINNALLNNKFVLHYQPVIDLKNKKILGVEALVRLLDENDNLVLPGDFIPFAEKTRLIHSINEWIIDKIMKDKQQWDNSHKEKLRVMINISGKSLARIEIVDEINEVLVKYSINPGEIALEVTETAAIDNYEDTIVILNKLSKAGFKISLDDFGIGYSSLTYLQKLPVDILKIDSAFLENIDKPNNNRFLFESIVKIAHNFNLKVVAEGVETEVQMQFVRETGCDMAQGFFLEEPMTLLEIEEILNSEKKY